MLKKIGVIAWQLVVFIGIPASFTFSLFNPTSDSPPILIFVSVILVFVAAFMTIFIGHRDYRVAPKFMKMAMAIYIAIVAFATLYRESGIIHGENVSYDPFDALYFSIVTWTTLGYGDFQPTESVRLAAAFQAMLGTLFIPMFLASLIFYLQATSSSNKTRQEGTP